MNKAEFTLIKRRFNVNLLSRALNNTKTTLFERYVSVG